MKKINIFLAVFIMLNISMITSLKAQWTNVPTTGIEGTCNVSKLFADGTDMYAYVKNGDVYKSTDNGDTWSIFNTGLPANVAIVAFTATPTKIYVAADKNGIYESDKATAGFTKLGTVPVLTNSFTSLENIKGTLYLGINGKGVYKCVISTAAYTQLTSGLANNAVVMTLTTDSITGVGRRLYAGVATDNGFYVKNDLDDTWVLKTISNEIVATNKAQVRSIFANQGKVILGGSSSTRGLLYSGSTTDFVTYTFTKTETNLPLDQQINAVTLVGNTIYVGNSRAVWKSTDITLPGITFSQVANGLQSPRASTPDLMVINSELWAAQASGGYMSSNGGTSWTRKLNMPTATTITGFKENAGKLYANTSSGIYESALGDGSDWLKFGNGINGSVPQFGLAFGDLGTYATCDGALFKLIGSNWESVNVEIGPRSFNHPIYGAMSDIAQFKNTAGVTRLFGSYWSSAGIYRYDGLNWALYSTYTATENSDGLFESGTDSVGRVIARFFLYDQEANMLFSLSKNRLQISKDFGNTWTWRMGATTAATPSGYTLTLGSTTVRSAVLKTIGAQKFLFMGTGKESSAWAMGKSEYAPDLTDKIGTNWTNTSTGNNNDVRDIINFENTPILVIRGTSAGTTNSVNISTENGINGKALETGITATKSSISCLGQFGDYVYLGTKTNEIQRYNVKAVPTFLATAPNVGSITTTTASLKATSS
ncbi:MAG: hypothetical protein GZ091_13315, partial [Paludibacter sp.]|nr:hypothetical protein [Paludibacter sp.]